MGDKIGALRSAADGDLAKLGKAHNIGAAELFGKVVARGERFSQLTEAR
ncbi:MAG: hypothetical protein ACR2NU_12825 [Aeoliella sp.]